MKNRKALKAAPLRYITESFGCDVVWDAETKGIDI